MNTNIIEVHGRGAQSIPVTQSGADFSLRNLWIEIPAAKLRKKLLPHPTVATGAMIQLNVSEVEKIPSTGTMWCVRDETDPNPELAIVLFEGLIERTGFVGAPRGA